MSFLKSWQFWVTLLVVSAFVFWWSYAVNAPNSIAATATTPAVPAPSIKLF